MIKVTNTAISSALTACLLLALALANTAFAQGAVYRWTGDDGVVHYGATPPMGVEAELVKTHNTGSSSPNTTATTPDTAEPGQEAEAKPELSPEMAARKAAMCKEEQDRLATLKKPGRIRMAQADGSTKYLSIEEIANEISVSEKVISDACN